MFSLDFRSLICFFPGDIIKFSYMCIEMDAFFFSPDFPVKEIPQDSYCEAHTDTPSSPSSGIFNSPLPTSCPSVQVQSASFFVAGLGNGLV
jgi:hypothetical protein